jgi:hypothetical protein
LRQLFRRAARTLNRRPAVRPVSRWRPSLEILDDRTLPSVSAITSNFNGTAIRAGSTVWFNSVMKVSGVGSSPVTIHVNQATISSPAFGATIAVPDATITFDPSGSPATTTFDDATNSWVTTVSPGLGGNTFLAGVAWQPAGGLKGGANPVVWSANFTTDTPGVTVQWQWAAAVYTKFSTDYTTLGVKPVDSNKASVFKNSDHAGTPESFRTCVAGGARGGGGSNFTGSYSATKSVRPDVNNFNPPAVPPAAKTTSLSGSVYFDDNMNGQRDGNEYGDSGVIVTLTGTDIFGNDVSQTAVTDFYGNYSFTGLAAGTYQLAKPPAGGQVHDVGASAGTVNGASRGTVQDNAIVGITLADGESGIHYDFREAVAG